MSPHRPVLATFAIVAALALPASAQDLPMKPVYTPAPPIQVAGALAGMLSCTLSPTVGLILGSLQTVSCWFQPAGPYPREAYVGTFGTLGVDIGVVATGDLGWQVYNQASGPLINALAGTYVGLTAEAGVGVGARANLLYGGSGRTVALQPVSLEGEVALNAVGGVSTLVLKPAY